MNAVDGEGSQDGAAGCGILLRVIAEQWWGSRRTYGTGDTDLQFKTKLKTAVAERSWTNVVVVTNSSLSCAELAQGLQVSGLSEEGRTRWTNGCGRISQTHQSNGGPFCLLSMFKPCAHRGCMILGSFDAKLSWLASRRSHKGRFELFGVVQKQY